MREPLIPQSSEENAPEWPTLKSSRSRANLHDPKASYAEKGNDLWLLTLSDLLLLLVVFFVLLFGLTFQQQSQASPAPREEAAAPVKSEEVFSQKEPKQIVDSEAEVLTSLEADLLAVLGDNGGKEGASVTRRANHVALTFPEKIVFDPGRAGIKPAAQTILQKVASLTLAHPGVFVEIQGHTDNRPIHNNRYASNWELSVDRATQVVKALIQLGINPTQISGRGFGEYRNLYPNDNDENRGRNRRVEIQISLPPKS